MSIATLLSQHHHVTAVDIIPEKVEMINNRKSPIQDDYIEKYLAEKDLDLTATLDAKAAYTEMVDKFLAKKYVASIIGQEHIIPTLGVWSHFDDIDFDELPTQFVLKCTHDSGGLVVCKDKNNLNKKAAKKKIENSMKTNYYKGGREWPYKNVKPQIIAEEYMEDISGNGLTDYKFYCFNGDPKYLYVSNGMDNHETARLSFLTMNWEKAPFGRSDYLEFEVLPPKPAKFDEMVKIAKSLSSGHPFLRVDLYEINNKVYFSELTFSPCGGFMPFVPEEWDCPAER